jgi:hypothetical protein
LGSGISMTGAGREALGHPQLTARTACTWQEDGARGERGVVPQ